MAFGVTLVAARPLGNKGAETPVVFVGLEESEPVLSYMDRQVSADSGAIVAWYNPNVPVTGATAEMQARQFLSAHRAELGLAEPDLADLELKAIREGLTGTTVRFRQYLAGIPVYKAEIAVHINRENRVTFVDSSYRPALQLTLNTHVLDRAMVRQAAVDYLDAAAPFSYDETALTIYDFNGTTRLAYQIRLEVGSPSGSWEILADAHTGAYFKVTDHATYNVVYVDNGGNFEGGVSVVDGTGMIFDPDPLTSAVATYGETGFVDGSDATTAQLDAERFLVTLKDIEDNSGTFTLRGPWAEVVDHDLPFKGLFSQASPTFNFDRAADAFEAVNTYYHIDASMRYLNETLGLNLEPFQYPGGVQYDPSGWNGADNSSYSLGSGRLSFGEGGVDDAEDSDVIHHELGHGLHDWVTNGSLSQVNGLSEGIGDFWAQSYNRSVDSWTPADPQYNWVFRWDGHNPFWGGRSTAYGATYPGGLTGSIHTDGQIWSTCMMKVWDAVGKIVADTAHWEGIGTTGSSTNQEAAANAVLQAAIDMGRPFSELEAMRNEFVSCGYTMMSILPIEPVAFLPIVVTTP